MKKIFLLFFLVLILSSCKDKHADEIHKSYMKHLNESMRESAKEQQEPDEETKRINDLLNDFKEIKQTYDKAEEKYDLKEYEKAINLYSEVFDDVIFYYRINEEDKTAIENSFGTQFDEIGECKLLYYSLYNIACCYSLMKDFEKAKEYLLYAIYAGYPSINYILKDSDMKDFFLSDESMKEDIENVFNQGNSQDLVQGKYKQFDEGNDSICYGFGDDIVIMYANSSDYPDHKFKGIYKVSNYHIIMDFNRVSYRAPDPWASITPGGGGQYSSYDPYPQFKDINKHEVINWFQYIYYYRIVLGGKESRHELRKLENFNVYVDWDEYEENETRYAELRKQRNKEYYSKKRKIERYDEEIKHNAEKRRQEVLDYITEVGEDSDKVFIVPEGTKKIPSDDIQIPEGTVALLLPEGLEIIDGYHAIPDTVKYINLPSTLKELNCYSFGPNSAISSLVLPENIEKVDGQLFWWSDGSIYGKRIIYVPGYIETPPEWNKYWDCLCWVEWMKYPLNENTRDITIWNGEVVENWNGEVVEN